MTTETLEIMLYAMDWKGIGETDTDRHSEYNIPPKKKPTVSLRHMIWLNRFFKETVGSSFVPYPEVEKACRCVRIGRGAAIYVRPIRNQKAIRYRMKR